ncbi:Testis-expressed protein 30 [Actinomortierella ambigua]|nr:Testis-expressed protein 30 [Actinomortierella ambigua]
MSEPSEQQIQVPWPGKNAIPLTITSPPEGVEPTGYALLLGPGAGGDENTPLFKTIAKQVAQHGHVCLRYRAKIPNLGFRVSLCKRVIEHVLHPKTGTHAVQGVFLGGHSMGTRVAGTTAADLFNGNETAATKSNSGGAKKGKKTTNKTDATTQGVQAEVSGRAGGAFAPDFVRGLVFCSYPLHTADNLKALRSEILLNIPSSVPTLFISGLSDTMCKPDLFNKVFKDMKSSPREVFQIQGADHGLGFGSAKGVAGKKETLAGAIADWIIAFMDEHIDGAREDEDKNGQASSSATKVKGSKGKTGAQGGIAVKKKVEVIKAETVGEWRVSISTIA